MEIINTSIENEQVGGNWWYCTPICGGSCLVYPALIAMGLVAYELF